MVVVAKCIVPQNFSSIALYPFIFIRNKTDKNAVLINHEKIHLKQQAELLVLFFYLWYGLEFIVRYAQYKNARQAYRNICFEKEAYSFENQLDYLPKRKSFSFFKFI